LVPVLHMHQDTCGLQGAPAHPLQPAAPRSRVGIAVAPLGAGLERRGPQRPRCPPRQRRSPTCWLPAAQAPGAQHVRPSISQSVSQSVHPSVHPPTRLPVCLSACLPRKRLLEHCPSVRPSICPSDILAPVPHEVLQHGMVRTRAAWKPTGLWTNGP
jgi:hypothetical protein